MRVVAALQFIWLRLAVRILYAPVAADVGPGAAGGERGIHNPFVTYPLYVDIGKYQLFLKREAPAAGQLLSVFENEFVEIVRRYDQCPRRGDFYPFVTVGQPVFGYQGIQEGQAAGLSSKGAFSGP